MNEKLNKMNDVNERVDKELEIFLLIFCAIIWERSIKCTNLYCKIKSERTRIDVLFKCLKYNMMAPTGLLSTMRPFLAKIYKNGFLLPSEYKHNKYVEKSIKLYREGYEHLKYWPEYEVNYNKFIYNYINKEIQEVKIQEEVRIKEEKEIEEIEEIEIEELEEVEKEIEEDILGKKVELKIREKVEIKEEIKEDIKQEEKDILEKLERNEFCDLVDDWNINLFLYSGFSDVIYIDMLRVICKTLNIKEKKYKKEMKI